MSSSPEYTYYWDYDRNAVVVTTNDNTYVTIVRETFEHWYAEARIYSPSRTPRQLTVFELYYYGLE